GCGSRALWKPIPPVTNQDTAPNTTTKPASLAKTLDRLGGSDVRMWLQSVLLLQPPHPVPVAFGRQFPTRRSLPERYSGVGCRVCAYKHTRSHPACCCGLTHYPWCLEFPGLGAPHSCA